MRVWHDDTEAVEVPGEAAALLSAHLGEQTSRHLELDLEHCTDRWEDVKRLVSEIDTETEWPPTPSTFCQLCPFNGNGCDAGDGAC